MVDSSRIIPSGQDQSSVHRKYLPLDKDKTKTQLSPADVIVPGETPKEMLQ
jgi:hypothetical protein